MPVQSFDRYIVEAPPEITPHIAQSRLREVNALLRSSLISSLRLGSDTALHVILDLAREIREFDGAILYVVHPERQEVIASFVRGFDHINLAGTELATGNLFLEWTLAHGRSFLVPSLEGEQEIATALRRFGSRSFLSVPCYINSHIAGTLQLFSRQADFFHPDDARLLLLLAIQAEAIFRSVVQRDHEPLATEPRPPEIFDRLSLIEGLRREMGRASRNRTPLSLILLAIGAAPGGGPLFEFRSRDKLMKTLKSYLQARLRPADLVARYDLQEIVALLPDTSETEARRVVRRLERGLGSEFPGIEQRQRPFFTLTTAAVPHEGPPTSEIIETIRSRRPPAGEQASSLAAADQAPIGATLPATTLPAGEPPPYRPELVNLNRAGARPFVLDPLLELFLAIGMECMGSRRGSLVVRCEQEKGDARLRLLASRGLESSAPLGWTELGSTSGVLRKVFDDCRPLVTADIHRDFPDLAAPSGRGYTSPSCLCLPILARGQAVGALCLTNRREDALPFGEADLERLSPLLRGAGLLIAEGCQLTTLQRAFLDLASLSIARLAETPHPWRQGHGQRVSGFAAQIARRMGLPPADVDLIAHAALLHDIGMIGIRPEVISTPGLYGERERQITQRHVTLGWKLLQTFPLDPAEQDVALHHHERMDGTGYPDGLEGSRIPIAARIVGVADVYDALTSLRPHRPARTPRQALEEMSGLAGPHLDPHVVSALREVVQRRD